jgi:hypothetical protein
VAQRFRFITGWAPEFLVAAAGSDLEEEPAEEVRTS